MPCGDFFHGKQPDNKMPKKPATKTDKPKLLSGGNPQIPKGYGDEVVQAYIAAMPGWKHDVGGRLDELIARTVPGVCKAVKWNTPLYGVEDQGWFLSFHCFTKYIKVAFLRGTSLDPTPPVASKTEEARYLHIYEDGEFDEPQFIDWVRQASAIPGENCERVKPVEDSFLAVACTFTLPYGDSVFSGTLSFVWPCPAGYR